MSKKFCISSEDIINVVAEKTGKKEIDFRISPIVIITFSRFLIDFFKTQMIMNEDEWLTPYHPYASNSIFRGSYNNKEITIIIPPMGASSVATVAEDLIFCGAQVILLACGCWAIGKSIQLLDFIISTHALGKDGTSIYYNRRFEEQTIINEEMVKILTKEAKRLTNRFHLGKNFSQEAFYKIEKNEIIKIQKSGCISMENGELNVLAAICNANKIKFGALFYNYYNPLDGWEIPWLSENYKDCLTLQGEILLNVIQKV
jgi:uridine phosphorylase